MSVNVGRLRIGNTSARPERNVGRRHAFSLLELMLALSLMVALMAVAWSLFGTYRDAEQRGWKIANRIQIIRAARSWLESDAQQFMIPVNGLHQPISLNGASPRFSGDAMGFSVNVSPSIDPLPFLEHLFARTSSQDDVFVNSNPTNIERQVVTGRTSPWPLDVVRVEYRLEPMPSNESMPSTLAMLDPKQVKYTLVRREWDDSPLPSSRNGSPSDRVLDGADLYRQTDEPINSLGQLISESQIDGLVEAGFQYFDGLQWKSSWNGASHSGLPLAIALGFQFPPVSDQKMPVRSVPSIEALDSTGSTTSPTVAWNPYPGDESSEVTRNMLSSTESSLMETSTSEVQIIVRMGANHAPDN